MRISLVPVFFVLSVCLAQDSWDPGKDLSRRILQASGERLKINFEFRSRLETRTGVGFGRDANLENPLFRTRIGAQFKASRWLKIVALGQDSRAPYYGGPAPNSARDTIDLQEGYLEFFSESKRGFGAIAGRQMVSLGEGRIIGVPQWGNTSRAYDTGRLYYRLPRARLEFLLVSIVKVRPDEYNRPVLGDRVWGVYNSFPAVLRKGLADVYALRHDQNGPGGFTGPGRLGVNTLGGRLTGPLPGAFKYSVEAAGQNGKVGTQQHRAFAWFSNLSHRIDLPWALDLSIEYKYASGTKDPQGSRSSTFDQLYAANHDKFGHADLFGWRNIHNLRSLNTAHIGKTLALNVMYNNSWLASARDALYNGQGRPLARSPQGAAGRHIGQEIDLFATHQWSGFQFGAGFAHLFAGEFLRKTTPGVNTRYLYIFQSYSF